MPASKPPSAADTAALLAAGERRRLADAELKRIVLDVLDRNAGSVRDIATHAGISTNTVSRWKRGD